MKKSIRILSLFIFLSLFCTKGMAQGTAGSQMKLTCEFNVTGLKSEKDAAAIDKIFTDLKEYTISSYTDYASGKTIVVVYEPLASPALLRKVVVKAGFDVDQNSFVIKKNDR